MPLKPLRNRLPVPEIRPFVAQKATKAVAHGNDTARTYRVSAIRKALVFVERVFNRRTPSGHPSCATSKRASEGIAARTLACASG